MGYVVSTSCGIGVGHALAVTGLPVAKVPLVVLDLLSAGVGGRGAGELGRCAFTDRGVLEVRRGLWIDDHLGSSAVGGTTKSDGASVSASHSQSAVRTGRVLLRTGESTWSSPAVCCTCLSVSRQLDGFSNTIRTAVVDQRRKDAAVSLAIAVIFLESNVTSTSAPVGDKKDEILSYLSVQNVSIFKMSCIETTVMKIAVWIVGGK